MDRVALQDHGELLQVHRQRPEQQGRAVAESRFQGHRQLALATSRASGARLRPEDQVARRPPATLPESSLSYDLSGSRRALRCMGDSETTAPATNSGSIVGRLAMRSAACCVGMSLSADLNRTNDGATLPLSARLVAKSLSAEMTVAPASSANAEMASSEAVPTHGRTHATRRSLQA